MMFFLCALIVFAIAAMDQLFKYWIVVNIPLGGHLDFLKNIVSLTHIHNTGAAYSMLENMRWLLLGVTAIAVIAIVVYMIKAKLTVSARVTLSMVLGGAVGNAIDRIAKGYVVDMFKLEFMRHAIFNIADAFITVGGVIFCILLIFDAYKDEKNRLLEEEAGKIVSDDDNYDDSDDFDAPFIDDDRELLAAIDRIVGSAGNEAYNDIDEEHFPISGKKTEEKPPVQPEPVPEEKPIPEESLAAEEEIKPKTDNAGKLQTANPVRIKKPFKSKIPETPAAPDPIQVDMPTYDMPVFKRQRVVRPSQSKSAQTSSEKNAESVDK